MDRVLITVATPSIRPEGLKVVQESLERQTFKDFEWCVELGIPGKGHDLNAAYNRILRRAKGELFVSLQDWTKILDDGLERFWKAYQENPRTFFTAPHGKTLDWKTQEWDWRAGTNKEGDIQPCNWNCWEIDWGCAPLSALKEIGGFDEALDQYWSCDNVSVGKRAQLAGYHFANLHTNPAVGLNHNKITSHPFAHRFNPEFNNERMKQIEMGELKIDYVRP